jgi:hypothetical protein
VQFVIQAWINEMSLTVGRGSCGKPSGKWGGISSFSILM